MRPLLLAFGIGSLTLAWAWPTPAGHGFAVHMASHMTIVAIAAPLLALAVGPAAVGWARWLPGPLPASLVELVAVWSWHAPALHMAARRATPVLWAEQASFLIAGVLLWLSVLSRGRGAAGIVALLLTSMHMTLLGVLLTLAPRPLYTGDGSPAALFDQQLGGILMLAVGGIVYLAGGLALLAGLLREPRAVQPYRSQAQERG